MGARGRFIVTMANTTKGAAKTLQISNAKAVQLLGVAHHLPINQGVAARRMLSLVTSSYDAPYNVVNLGHAWLVAHFFLALLNMALWSQFEVI